MSIVRCLAAIGCCVLVSTVFAQPTSLDAALLQRIEAFVERERQTSGIPGIGLAIVHSVGDASTRITLRHLLNQTSGFSRADGVTPLLQDGSASIEELARGLGAVLQAVAGRPWQDLLQARVLRPLGMRHSDTDHDAARQAGMTAVHRMWFGVPVVQNLTLPPGFAPTGSLVASAGDMARYLDMMLADGSTAESTAESPLVSVHGVTQLLAPASPPARSHLLSADFEFCCGEGWFVGPFRAATDARWHLGNMASFVAWMVLLPDTQQAVAILINANTGLPCNDVNAVMSRLPIGVVNLLRGQPVPAGPSLRSAYLRFNAESAMVVIGLAALAWCASRTRRDRWSVLMLLMALVMVVALPLMGLGAAILLAFAPDLALVLAAVVALLCVPMLVRAWARIRRSLFRRSGVELP